MKPYEPPNSKTRLALALTASNLKRCFNRKRIMPRVAEAIIRRQKAMEDMSRALRNLMKMAAVPNRIPSSTPSIKAVFRFLSNRLEALFFLI